MSIVNIHKTQHMSYVCPSDSLRSSVRALGFSHGKIFPVQAAMHLLFTLLSLLLWHYSSSIFFKASGFDLEIGILKLNKWEKLLKKPTTP